ncbi:MAG: VanZ family protein [Candidatus Competibacteraceae bacterium]|nr:VanZ family protein [Candidatus Competibacteraceae bacterium]
MPASEVPRTPFLSFDKFFHVAMFAFLSFQLMVGLRKQYQFPKLRYHAIKFSLIFGLLYGIYTELMQGWLMPGRFADWKDMLANSIGIFLGWATFALIYQWDVRKKNKQAYELSR